MRALPFFLALALLGCRTVDKEPEIPDADADGYNEDEDCDDDDAEINPGMSEVPYDGVDNDCNADTLDDDLDGDGYLLEEDCDDEDADVFPGATEVCNGVDDDCDGEVDDSVGDLWYTDADADGFGDGESPHLSCDHTSGWVDNADDCDDTSASVHPGGTEVCNEVDDDCDGAVDEDAVDAPTWYYDGDADGYGDPDTTDVICVPDWGWVLDDEDCDDSDAGVHPGATEVCDEVDQDCDGGIDEEAVDQSTWYVDADGDGYGSSAVSTQACSLPAGFSDNTDDCDDAHASANPDQTEVCDELDNDCDGDVDEGVTTTFYADGDADGYGNASVSVEECTAPSGFVTDATDCDDGNASANPGQAEVCDEEDNDCDGDTDEGVTTTFYYDADSDGYGLTAVTTEACSLPSGYAADDGDCDDTDSAYNPGATPGCDGEDYDCDGDVDSDADSDGYADESCGGDDCDDTDASVIPDSNGLCAYGPTCADIAGTSYDSGDGDYVIDPDGWGTGEDPFYVTCDMSTDGGGWTLVFHVFDMGSATSGLYEDDFISLFGHQLWTDETWSYDAGTTTMYDEMDSDGLVLLGTQGMVDIDWFSGLWDDVRMSCSLSDSDATESEYIQVDGYVTSNGNDSLLGAASNGTSYSVDSTLNSMGISTTWHDNETTTSNSGHFMCDYTNTASSGAAPQFGFCYTDHLHNTNTYEMGDSVVSLAWGYGYGSDSWSVGFTLECGDMDSSVQQNTGTYSIWIR